MSLDIGDILRDWPYETGQVTVRRIRGQDGRDKIQLRLDLGLLQMETSGRPDGQRPNGFESLLAFHEHRLVRYREERGHDDGFELDEQVCDALRGEGVMYYHRYLAEFVLEDYEAVERDTSRNLRLLDFCQTYAKEESDRYALEQFRAYILMMYSRARARIALREERPKAALAAVKKGIEAIRASYKRFGREKLLSGSAEIAVLRAMAKDIAAAIPVDPMRKLRLELARAVREERYEDAARIRDRLSSLTAQGEDAPDDQAQP